MMTMAKSKNTKKKKNKNKKKKKNMKNRNGTTKNGCFNIGPRICSAEKST